MKKHSLQAELDELERTDPKVRAAARKYAETVAAIINDAPSSWPQMRIVRLDDTFAEIRIGGARWTIRLDQWDDASKFLEHVRHLWDMRVVWANEGTPVDGPCAKRLLDENQRMRDALKKIEGGEGCSTPSYGDCCDMACARVARDALAVPTGGEGT